MLGALGFVRRAVGLALLVGCAHSIAAVPTVVTLTPEVLPLQPFATGTLTVTIDAPAPNGGTIITLAASPADTLTLPREMTINAGLNFATFTVSANVAAGSAEVTAVLGSSSSTTTVVIGDYSCQDAAGAAQAAGSGYAITVGKVPAVCVNGGTACNDAIAESHAALKAIVQAHRSMKATCRPTRP